MHHLHASFFFVSVDLTVYFILSLITHFYYIYLHFICLWSSGIVCFHLYLLLKQPSFPKGEISVSSYLWKNTVIKEGDRKKLVHVLRLSDVCIHSRAVINKADFPVCDWQTVYMQILLIRQMQYFWGHGRGVIFTFSGVFWTPCRFWCLPSGRCCPGLHRHHTHTLPET